MINFDELKTTNGLVSAIVQDVNTLQVLMLGYMNKAAFEKTLATKRVTFYSRSRETLWVKGETSGNFLNLISLAADCDKDALLIEAIPEGPTCHLGTKTCWGEAVPESLGFIRQLQSIVQQRHRDMPKGSYTTELFNSGVNRMAQKVGEEAVETVIEAMAANRERLIYEASDLIYHLLVLLESQAITLADLEAELYSRHK